jgi:threonine synthase
MAAEKLKCKECGTEYPLEALYVCERCFGPLEVAYDHSRLDIAALRRRIQAGREDIWRYADFLPLSDHRRDPGNREIPLAGLPVGWTPLIRADRLGERSGCATSGSRTTPPTRPTRSRTASSRSPRRVPASSASRRSPAPRRATSATRSRRRRRRSACRPTSSSRPTSRSRRSSRPASTARTWSRSRQLRRRQPPLHRALGRARRLGVRQHQHAPVLRRGLEDARVRDRRAARLGAAGPLVVPIASGSLFTKIARGFEEWLDVGLLEGQLPVMNGAQATGCSPVASAFEAGRTSASRSSRHDRQVAGDRQPRRRPYALDLARRTRRLDRRGQRRADPRRHRLLAQTTGIFTETAGGVTTAVLKSSPSAATSIPTSASCS